MPHVTIPNIISRWTQEYHFFSNKETSSIFFNHKHCAQNPSAIDKRFSLVGNNKDTKSLAGRGFHVQTITHVLTIVRELRHSSNLCMIESP
jgi:hypothetical protein